jgi:hypothetical protein
MCKQEEYYLFLFQQSISSYVGTYIVLSVGEVRNFLVWDRECLGIWRDGT